VLILILYGLPGGILGFIQERDFASADDYATRMHKAVRVFARKFWFFFAGMLFFTAFFSILLEPGSWLLSEEWEFELAAIQTWGIVPRTLLQAVVGVIIFSAILRGVKAFSQTCRLLMLLVSLTPVGLHIYLGTPLSGILISALLTLFVYVNLLQADVRQAFGRQHRAELRAVPSVQ
jgi:hypothetical protein